ncbi:MAG: methionine biosynthesis protein MetW [Pseudomonadales bacterium]
MRPDLKIIADLVNPGARVLDLGCGEGELLAHLRANKGVNGYGLDVDASNITTCLAKGVNVIEHDLDAGLQQFADDAFDMVVMTETLQSVHHPEELLKEMLRIGRECIVTFPNFGHWRCRLHLGLRGRMPIVNHLPYAWYDTPNIRLCTFDDFERLCHARRYRIIQRFVTGPDYHPRHLAGSLPNLFGTIAFYRLGRSI